MPKKIDRRIPGADTVFDWDAAVSIAKEHLQRRLEPERIYRLRDLMQLTGLSRSTIYGLIQEGKFPSPIKLTKRASGWRSSDIATWIASRD